MRTALSKDIPRTGLSSRRVIRSPACKPDFAAGDQPARAVVRHGADFCFGAHLAQVAAYANAHLRVLKTSSTEFTATDVVSLNQSARIEELARMLSGLSDSESGLAHAAELRERALAEFA